MKVQVKYQTDVEWRKAQLDLELMLYEGHLLPSGNALLRQVRHLQDLAYVVENNKTIFVLREPMDLRGGQIEYDAVEFNIDFIINSSKILFVTPQENVVLVTRDEEEIPPSEKALQYLDQYLEKEEKRKKEERLTKLSNIGKPR